MHVTLGRGDGLESSRRKRINKESIVFAVIAMMAIVIVAWVLTPSISPLAGIHDSDRDGYPDLKDQAPSDPTKWTWGVATVVVTLHSGHTLNDTHYMVYLNEYLKKEGDLAPGAQTTKFISVKFLMGTTNSTQVVVTATSTGGEWGDRIDQETLIVRDGHAYAVALTI